MRQGFFSIPILLRMSSGVEASCVDPSTLVHSTVSITREFSEEERTAAPAILGIRGTGWFLSPRLIVTAAHVAEAMHLSVQDWKEIEIRERESKVSLPARILHLAGSHTEKMAVLELRTSFPGAAALPIRTEPLVPEELVVSLAYPNSRPALCQRSLCRIRGRSEVRRCSAAGDARRERPARARSRCLGSARARLQGPGGGGRQHA